MTKRYFGDDGAAVKKTRLVQLLPLRAETSGFSLSQTRRV